MTPSSLAAAVAQARVALQTDRAVYIQETLTVDDDDALPCPRPTGTQALPDPARWAGQVAHVLLEVITGQRPLHQLTKWVSSEVYAVAARRHAVAVRRLPGHGRQVRPRVRVLRVRVCEPADGVAEAAVVVLDGDRVRAMALRLVGQDGRWVVHTMELG
jgi:hypothetical protein